MKNEINYLDENIENNKGFNVLLLVLLNSFFFLLLNVFFFQIQNNIDYFELIAHVILLLTTFYLIYITQKNSTNQSSFYYYTSIGFSFLFFGLLILTMEFVYIYPDFTVKVPVKLLFVFGYSLLAIGVTKWVKYNETRQDELSLQANTDELTGILNRRSFTSFINFEYKNSRKNSQPFSLIIIDIDLFKVVNDKYGHLVGDEVLKDLAEIMRKSFRSGDKVCRWGGEEFAILLPNTSLTNAKNVAEKLRLKVESHNFQHQKTAFQYTISAGVSESLSSDKGIDDITQRADQALYMAKDSNRNCVRTIRA